MSENSGHVYFWDPSIRRFVVVAPDGRIAASVRSANEAETLANGLDHVGADHVPIVTSEQSRQSFVEPPRNSPSLKHSWRSRG